MRDKITKDGWFDIAFKSAKFQYDLAIQLGKNHTQAMDFVKDNTCAGKAVIARLEKLEAEQC